MDKLDEIIQKQNLENGSVEIPYTGREILSVRECKKIALEFAKHILDEAAESANVGEHYPNPYDPDSLIHLVDKKSITDVLNKYL